MGRNVGLVIAAACLIGTAGIATAQLSPGSDPSILTLQPAPESVYAPPAPIRENEGVNQGGVNLDLDITYFTDYLWRGIERFEPPGSEDDANLQIDGIVEFDLGNSPHPFVGVFVNIAEADPISTFQEIRPFLGLEWKARPFIMAAGYTSYIFPDRDSQDTQEIWGRLELDDSYFLRSNDPFLSPYIFAAYDIDLYQGWYVEGGVEHDFHLEDTGLTLTLQAQVAYVYHISLFDAEPLNGEEAAGFQHYQLGLIGTYSLNHLLNMSQRYGEWSMVGYLYYTDGIDPDLRADTQLWGGVGVNFRY